MQKLPLYIKGSFYDNGRAMTKAEARKIARAIYGQAADVVQCTTTAGITNGFYSKEWRVIV